MWVVELPKLGPRPSLLKIFCNSVHRVMMTPASMARSSNKAGVVQIAVVERILVVPFDFQRHPVLVAVHLVGRRDVLVAVHDNLLSNFFSAQPSLVKWESSLLAIRPFEPPGFTMSLFSNENPRKTSTIFFHSSGCAADKMASPLRHSWTS